MQELSLAGGDADIAYARNPKGLFYGFQRSVVPGKLIAYEPINRFKNGNYSAPGGKVPDKC